MFKTLDELTRDGRTTPQMIVAAMIRWVVATAMTAFWIPVFMYLLPSD